MPLQRAHVRVELAAQLARIFEAQMYTLFVAPQMAFVRCSIVAPIAGILHSQVHAVPVLLHGLAAQEAGPTEVAHLPTVRVEAGPVLPQLFPTGGAEVAEVARGVLAILIVIQWINTRYL